jgi:hypothetical protein
MFVVLDVPACAAKCPMLVSKSSNTTAARALLASSNKAMATKAALYLDMFTLSSADQLQPLA